MRGHVSSSHKKKLREILNNLSKKGLLTINMDKLRAYPDGIAIDFKRKIVFAIEVEVLSKSKSLSDAQRHITDKYHGSKLIPMLVTTISDKEEKRIRY